MAAPGPGRRAFGLFSDWRQRRPRLVPQRRAELRSRGGDLHPRPAGPLRDVPQQHLMEDHRRDLSGDPGTRATRNGAPGSARRMLETALVTRQLKQGRRFLLAAVIAAVTLNAGGDSAAARGPLAGQFEAMRWRCHGRRPIARARPDRATHSNVAAAGATPSCCMACGRNGSAAGPNTAPAAIPPGSPSRCCARCSTSFTVAPARHRSMEEARQLLGARSAVLFRAVAQPLFEGRDPGPLPLAGAADQRRPRR